MKRLILLSLIIPLNLMSQQILPNANVIVAKNVTFLQACNALLDSGYIIHFKDNELMTAETDQRQYPKYWNATYRIKIRIKDSCAYITGDFTAPPGGGLFYNERVINRTDKTGKTKPKSVDGSIFILLDAFAHSLSSDITYAKQ